MDNQRHQLNWRKTKAGWAAWAVRLLPADKFPPYYLLTPLKPNGKARLVELVRPTVGAEVIDSVDNFTNAKLRAQSDYDSRVDTTTSDAVLSAATAGTTTTQEIP